jgi:FixJ family two-component response regulator
MDRVGSTVAVIDDDDDVRDVLRVLLESAGHEVETYKSGAQFLESADTSQIGCLVVDQRMPRMTGLELLTELNSRGLALPSLLITGTHDNDVARKATELGAMTVLEKPMSHHELLRFVSFSLG